MKTTVNMTMAITLLVTVFGNVANAQSHNYTVGYEYNYPGQTYSQPYTSSGRQYSSRKWNNSY